MTDNKWAEEKADSIVKEWLESVRNPIGLGNRISRALLEAKRDGFNRGIEKAALEVETHWNSSDTMTNQKQQALRSAYVIRKLKED